MVNSKQVKIKNLPFPLRIFAISLGSTIVVWMLRGFGILTFIPGGVIWLLILLTIATGIWLRLQRWWSRL